MKPKLKFNNGYFTALLLTILTGCAAPPPVLKHEDFSKLAHKTFSAGIRDISERYIDPVLVSDLAIEGIRGLESIDERLNVKVTSSNVSIKLSKNSTQTFSKPLKENAEKWAETMEKAVQFLRTHSNLIGRASKEAVFAAVFDGSTSLLDAFSRYSGPKKAREERAKRSGFGGIGVVPKPAESGALIITVIKYSPAFTAGIKTGDIITHVDGAPIKGLSFRNLTDVFRGEIGSLIEVTIKRNNRVHLNISLKREKVILPTVKLTKTRRILLVQVSHFYNDTAQQIESMVKDAIRTAEKPIAGMILDLRGNRGGILSQAIKVADLFLPKGKILTTWGRHPSSRKEYLAKTNELLAGHPLIVLINGRSASASEIVAAALQDHKRSILVGTSTFGKGLVQTVSQLPNDGEITLTWSKFVTPSGYILHGLGVPPNICSNGKDRDAEKVVFRTIKEFTKLNQLMESWQEVPVANKQDRIDLRQICPASNINRNVDIKIAEKLILNPNLYGQILGLNSSFAFAPD